jgi:hypothetical protein
LTDGLHVSFEGERGEQLRLEGLKREADVVKGDRRFENGVKTSRGLLSFSGLRRSQAKVSVVFQDLMTSSRISQCRTS